MKKGNECSWNGRKWTGEEHGGERMLFGQGEGQCSGNWEIRTEGEY